MKHVKHDEPVQHSSFRQLAIGAWGSPTDPKVYTKIKCDITYLQTLLKQKSARTPVSLVHFFAYVMGQVFDKYPELNRVLLRGKLYQRASIDAFIHTHIREKTHYDLSGITIPNIHEQSLEELSQLITKKTSDIREKKNKSIQRTRKIVSRVPALMLPLVIKCLDFWLYSLNIGLWGLPKDPYGSFGITAVGSLGFEEAFVPLFPFSRMPMMLALGKPYTLLKLDETEKPVERTYVNLCFTMDHRYYDGADLAKPLRYLKKLVAKYNKN